MKIKHYLKINARMLGAYAAAQGICIAMWFMAFSSFCEHAWGQVMYTVFFSGFLAIWMYSNAYKIGERDTKSYSENKPYALKGFTICIMQTSVSLLLFGLSFTGNPVLMGLFKLWNYNAVYMIINGGTLKNIAYIMIFALPVLASFFGYLAGMYRYELGYKFFSKLVYKQK